MPRLPWLLGPYWPMVEIDVVMLSRADLVPLCVAKLASAPEIIDFLERSLQFVDRFTGPNSR